MSDALKFYMEYKSTIDRWAKSAQHPLLKACARVVRGEALRELQSCDEEYNYVKLDKSN